MTTTVSGVVCRRLDLATINLSIKFEGCISHHYEGVKGDTKYGKLGGFGLLDSYGSINVTIEIALWSTIERIRFASLCPCLAPCLRYSETVVENADFSLPTYIFRRSIQLG